MNHGQRDSDPAACCSGHPGGSPPHATRRRRSAAERAPGDHAPPGPVGERGRGARAARDARAHRAHQSALPVGRGRAVTSSSASILRRAGADALADRRGDGLRLPARHRRSRRCGCRATPCCARSASATSGWSARCRRWCSCCSGTSSPRSTRSCRSASRSGQSSSPSGPRTCSPGSLAAFVGAHPGRGRVLGRDRARRPPVGRAGPDRGGPGARPRPGADLPADRAAAGDAGDRARRPATC